MFSRDLSKITIFTAKLERHLVLDHSPVLAQSSLKVSSRYPFSVVENWKYKAKSYTGRHLVFFANW